MQGNNINSNIIEKNSSDNRITQKDYILIQKQDICPKCSQSRNSNATKFLIQDIITRKYENQYVFFYLKVINDILTNSRVQHVQLYKEYLFVDDENQYLRRFYNKGELAPRLQKILKFYKKKFPQPHAVLARQEFEERVMKRNKKQNKLFYELVNQQQDSTQLQTPTSLVNDNNNPDSTPSESQPGSRILKSSLAESRAQQTDQKYFLQDSQFSSNGKNIRKNRIPSSSSGNKLDDFNFIQGNNQNSNTNTINEGERLQTLQSSQNLASVIKYDSTYSKGNQPYSFLKDLQKDQESISFETTVHDIFNPQFTEQSMDKSSDKESENQFWKTLKGFNIKDYEIKLPKTEANFILTSESNVYEGGRNIALGIQANGFSNSNNYYNNNNGSKTKPSQLFGNTNNPIFNRCQNYIKRKQQQQLQLQLQSQPQQSCDSSEQQLQQSQSQLLQYQQQYQQQQQPQQQQQQQQQDQKNQQQQNCQKQIQSFQFDNLLLSFLKHRNSQQVNTETGHKQKGNSKKIYEQPQCLTEREYSKDQLIRQLARQQMSNSQMKQLLQVKRNKTESNNNNNQVQKKSSNSISNQLIKKLINKDKLSAAGNAQTCYTQIETNQKQSTIHNPNTTDQEGEVKQVYNGSNQNSTQVSNKKKYYVSKSTEFTSIDIQKLRQKRNLYKNKMATSGQAHSTQIIDKRNPSAQSLTFKGSINSLHEQEILKKSQIFYRKINSNISSQYLNKKTPSMSKTNDTLSKEKSSSISQSLIYKQVSNMQTNLNLHHFKQKFKSMQNQEYLSPRQDTSKQMISSSSKSLQNSHRNYKNVDNPYQFEINNIVQRNPQKAKSSSSNSKLNQQLSGSKNQQQNTQKVKISNFNLNSQ